MGFFKDPFFQDLRSGLDDGLEKRLAEFSARSLGLSGAGLGEAAHNIQVSASNEKFMIQLELPGFSPEDFSLKTKDDVIIIEAKHNAKTDDGSTDTRHFTKEFKMPSGVATDQLGSTYSGAGILTISAPRSISAPEGAQVREAVKKDDKASSQSIAATTQSEDGSTISSFKSSSSSSSSSTMMSSGSGGPMPMMGGMGGMQMPSLMGGQGMQMQKMGDMDDMMSKMMSKMGGMNMGSSSMGSNSMSSKSSFSPSSSSSFSSSSSSSMMSSDMSSMMGGMPPMRGMQMPQMGGFDMPGLSFREMPDMPLSPGGASTQSQPEYTVTPLP